MAQPLPKPDKLPYYLETRNETKETLVNNFTSTDGFTENTARDNLNKDSLSLSSNKNLPRVNIDSAKRQLDDSKTSEESSPQKPADVQTKKIYFKEFHKFKSASLTKKSEELKLDSILNHNNDSNVKEPKKTHFLNRLIGHSTKTSTKSKEDSNTGSMMTSSSFMANVSSNEFDFLRSNISNYPSHKIDKRLM